MPANSEQSQPTATVDQTPVTTEPAPEQSQTTETEQTPESSAGPASESATQSATESATEPATEPATESATGSAKPAARRRHVWRCAPSTLIAAVAFMVVTAIAIPGAAVWAVQSGFTAFGDQPRVVLSILGVLAVLCLVYGWRMVLHPRIKIKNDEVIVHNPLRTHRIHLDDITRFRPGGDGLVVATSDTATEAWCVQKSTGAIRANRRTRADEVCDELWAYWDEYHRPDVGAEGPVKLRFARPVEADLLMQVERSASTARLGHIFPPEEFPFPEEDIRQRWQANLDDPHRLIMVAVVDGEPAGYACFGDKTLFHLGVSGDHQRKGIGSLLLEAAEDEMFDAATPQIQLWVLEENQVARTFYRERGWQDTGESRNAEFAPHPVEVKMVRRNPHLARRGR